MAGHQGRSGQPAGWVGMGDRSNGTGAGRTDVQTSSLRTIDRILYRFPDGEADGSGTVLEDG